MNTVYEDKRGWRYQVMGGLGDSNWKARYLKPGKSGWHCVATLPWRTTEEEAQADLDELAIRKKWSKVFTEE